MSDVPFPIRWPAVIAAQAGGLTAVVMLIAGVFSEALAQDKLTEKEILELYKGLRVADVSDGMDMVGLRDVGLLDQKIEALWKDIGN